MKTKFAITTVSAILLAMSMLVAACGGGTSGTAPAGVSQAGGGQVVPVAGNPIKNSSAAAGLEITSARVEDNADPETKKNIPDCLQIELKNNSAQTMSNLEIFYKMTDSTTGASEGYYQKLEGLTLNPGQAKTIFFDNNTGSPGHYPENRYSIYRTSKNEVVFSIELSAPGFKPATAETKKSPGTSEQQD